MSTPLSNSSHALIQQQLHAQLPHHLKLLILQQRNVLFNFSNNDDTDTHICPCPLCHNPQVVFHANLPYFDQQSSAIIAHFTIVHGDNFNDILSPHFQQFSQLPTLVKFLNWQIQLSANDESVIHSNALPCEVTSVVENNNNNHIINQGEGDKITPSHQNQQHQQQLQKQPQQQQQQSTPPHSELQRQDTASDTNLNPSSSALHLFDSADDSEFGSLLGDINNHENGKNGDLSHGKLDDDMGVDSPLLEQLVSSCSTSDLQDYSPYLEPHDPGQNSTVNTPADSNMNRDFLSTNNNNNSNEFFHQPSFTSTNSSTSSLPQPQSHTQSVKSESPNLRPRHVTF
ncbi:unnamed protein product [Ambrosiozyma monospora]|uniref:Unnamed protein product n=1 Tax=Ambrosiozyma monospora TaxID=43982 RepID=A0ACB5TQW8_AMBMO|nr:unnamed protein product [Ambrosiozyma monospora]